MSGRYKILICYNEPLSLFANYSGKENNQVKDTGDLSETDFKDNLKLIVDSLSNFNYEVDTLAINRDMQITIKNITSYNPNVIFNFVEAVEGISDFESYMTGIYELLGYHYTGSGTLSLANCQDKVRTKQILKSAGIATPNYFLFDIEENITKRNFSLKFPVILKLSKEDASIGISEESVVYDFNQVRKRCKFLFNNYGQNVIAEEFINGREINVSILGDKVLPPSEIIFDGLPKKLANIITYEAKWFSDSIYYKHSIPRCPAKLNNKQLKLIEEAALNSFQVLGCRDYARVDIRLTKNDVPYVIEVNPNPDITINSGFFRSSKEAGYTYDELLNTIIKFALKRYEYFEEIKE